MSEKSLTWDSRSVTARLGERIQQVWQGGCRIADLSLILEEIIEASSPVHTSAMYCSSLSRLCSVNFQQMDMRMHLGCGQASSSEFAGLLVELLIIDQTG